MAFSFPANVIVFIRISSLTLISVGQINENYLVISIDWAMMLTSIASCFFLVSIFSNFFLFSLFIFDPHQCLE